MKQRTLANRIVSITIVAMIARTIGALMWRASSFGVASAAIPHPGAGSERLVIPRAPAREESAASRLRSFGDRYWAELIAAAVALGATIYVISVLTREALPPSGDSGQWLTISRYYLGEAMPSDRSATVVPPITPLLLAGLSLVFSKPMAIVALAAICYASIAVLVFLLGRRISGGAAGGLLAVILVSVAQRELFEIIAVGAYPQLIAVAGMAACLLALLSLVEAPSQGRWWTVLAGGTGVVLFSHTPTATVLLPPLVACLAYIVWSAEQPKDVLKAALGALRPVVLLWALFIAVNHDVIFGYANVPATFDLKGPDRMWNTIWNHDAQRLVFGAGALATLALPWLLPSTRGWRGRPGVVLLIWTSTIAAMVAFSAARHVNTDYPRFIAYFIVPFGVAAAAGIQACSPSRKVVLALAAPMLLFAGFESMSHLSDASRFYGVNAQSDELVDAADWLNASGAEGGVIGGTRDTKWVQALTGRTSLLYLRRISITRPWEIDRAIAADVVLRSSGGIESGRLLTTVNDGGQDFGAVHRPGVRIDAFHKGIYSPALEMQDRETRLTFESLGKTRTLPLGAFTAETTTAETLATGFALTTRYTSDELPIEVVRVVSGTTGSAESVNIAYYVGAPAGVGLTQVTIRTGAEEPLTLTPGVLRSNLETDLFDGSPLPVAATSTWIGAGVPPVDANPFLAWQNVGLALRVPAGEQRIDQARLYDPLAVLHEYGVRYIIDRDGDGAAFPIIRGHALTPAYSNGEFAIYDVGE